MATATTEAAGQAAEAASAPGMPQLDFSTWGNQIFWLIVTLVVIYLILSRVALPRISAVLAERAGTITNDIAAAEDLKRKAEEAEAAFKGDRLRYVYSRYANPTVSMFEKRLAALALFDDLGAAPNWCVNQLVWLL